MKCSPADRVTALPIRSSRGNLNIFATAPSCMSDKRYSRLENALKRAVVLIAIAACTPSGVTEHLSPPHHAAQEGFRGGVRVRPLITTRFRDLDHFKERVSLHYEADPALQDRRFQGPSAVTLRYEDRGIPIVRRLASGTNQGDLTRVQDTDWISKALFVFNNPYAVRKRKELEVVSLLSRRRADIFGSKDVAFYDLAESSFRNINTPTLAFFTVRDSSEKGFINTFNHVTAQAIITSFFSEDLADLVGDLHERLYMPELTTGRFTGRQLADTINNPLDNYVDIINNEIGQMLGLDLKKRYRLKNSPMCTPALLTAYLNDLQSYYMETLQIGLDPYRPSDEVVVKFSKKLNALLASL